jgi:hypothetical protein
MPQFHVLIAEPALVHEPWVGSENCLYSRKAKNFTAQSSCGDDCAGSWYLVVENLGQRLAQLDETYHISHAHSFAIALRTIVAAVVTRPLKLEVR